jgi:multiple sugar transport system permease protein
VIGYPLVRSVVLSLYRYDLLSPFSRPFVGLQNYRLLFQDPVFWEALKNTLIFNTATVVGGFLIGFGFALLLNRELPLRGLFRSLALIPWVVPYVVIGFLFLFIFNQKIGIANFTLVKLGILEQYLPWLADPSLELVTVTLASIWNQFLFHMLTLLAGLQTVPGELEEAATTFVIYVFQKAFVEFKFGYSSAIGIVWLLVLVGFAAFYMRAVQREEF